MKKYFLFISVAATAILIFFACKKENNSNNNNSGTTTGANPTGTTTGPSAAGTFGFNSITNVGYGSNPSSYSYNAYATFTDGANKMSAGTLTVNGIAFTLSGDNYNYATQTGQPGNIVNWLIGSYSYANNTIHVPTFSLSKTIPIVQEIVGDSIDRTYGKPYKTPCNISVCDSVEASLALSYGDYFINATRDSLIFDYNYVSNALATLGTLHKGSIVPIQIIIVNYKDTLIGGKNYQFSSRKITYTHAFCKN